MKCYECHKDNKIVAFERFGYDAKIEILVPVCDRCVEKIQRDASGS